MKITGVRTHLYEEVLLLAVDLRQLAVDRPQVRACQVAVLKAAASRTVTPEASAATSTAPAFFLPPSAAGYRSPPTSTVSGISSALSFNQIEQWGGAMMQRSIFGALGALALLTWTARVEGALSNPLAQDRPAAGPERVVMDAVFWTLPGPVSDTCLELPAGQLTVTVQLEGREPTQPVSYRFGPYRYREPDPTATIAHDIAHEPTTTTVPLTGGRYCYAIINRAKAPPGTDVAGAGPIAQAQDVAVTMVLTPR